MDAFFDDLLSFLENREVRLLSWGFYDVAFRPGEIDTALTAEAPAALRGAWEQRRRGGETLAAHFGRLADAGLLYRIEDGGDRFRTRFAEGVRLMAHLRQMFNADQWATAPNLVADMKLLLKPRRYPLQDQSAADCWRDLEKHARQPQLQRELFDALARRTDGQELAFAGFQRRAFTHIFEAFGRDTLSGTVVSAGTGAGKTKAFYVPALLQVAADLDRPPFPRLIAIYPRNVLLADQLREALAEAAKLTPVLRRHGLRPLRIGALLGQTPWENSFDRKDGKLSRATRWHSWLPTTGGFRIPFLRSPLRADLDLVWRDEDRRAKRYVLFPAGGRETHIEAGTLAFTRDDLLREPPDVLFLSAEMLNREMGNPAWQAVLGLGQPPERTPRLLLLDEVHAYEGAAGAQVAWILRRWRYWARPRTLHVVGLSATLRHAPQHLAQVVGMSQERVQAFEPFPNELGSEAQEYSIAVKGDAGSGASLLSTTIQCGMLLSRMLTPLRQAAAPPAATLRPEAVYGRKVFGFTDNLDVINRWLSDLIDAERNQRLAGLRLHPAHRSPPENLLRTVLRQMDAAGQIWELPRRLGHDLTRPLGIGRCSSQDPGLDADKDFTVATSALEVGFDDPLVGAVLQHKSPSSLASFVQRKGRAGRQRGTRPWTVVVLSDYGRDRWNFQQIERLFEPQIEDIRLPTANPYVLRIQATYFLLDWLGRRLGSQNGRGPFSYLRGPSTPALHDRAARLVRDLLACGPVWAEFRNQLGTCLRAPLDASGRRLSEAEFDAILWEPPRPLLREVLPSLLRRLEASWTFADPARAGAVEDAAYRHPLPEFLPRATFADLDVAEVALELPGDPDHPEFLDIGHALFETCPGRASKRFAIKPGQPGNWHPFSSRLTGGDHRASVAELYPDSIALGGEGVAIYQPLRAVVEPHDTQTLESSYASWEWESQFRPEGRGRSLPLPGGTVWSGVIAGVEAFLHRDQGGIEVTRLARSCRYEVFRHKEDPRRGRLLLERTVDGARVPEAVGFRHKPDGLRVRLRPEFLRTLPTLPPDLLARFRAEYFLYVLRQSPLLVERAGSFRIDWLWQTSLAMLTATAVRRKCSLREAQEKLADIREGAAHKVLREIFRSRGIGPDGEVAEGKQQEAIRELWADPEVCAEVARLETVLWADPDDAFHDWTRCRFAATLAQALRTAVISRQDNVAEEDFLVDVTWGQESADIYLTELSSGGLGQIELVWQRLVRDPGRLFEGLEHALTYCPRAENTAFLCGVVACRCHPRLARAFRSVRQARDLAAMEVARNRLRVALRRLGCSAVRDGVVSLLTRVLRPGSTTDTDALLHQLNRLWRRREASVGLGIDQRVFAYHCLHHPGLRQRLTQTLSAVGLGQTPTAPQLYALVLQMLLLDCPDSCPECLDQPNRYSPPLQPSRALARLFLGFGGSDLVADQHPNDWPNLVRAALCQRGTVRLRVSCRLRARVAEQLAALLAEELEVDYLLLPLRLRRIDRHGSDWLLTLELRDVIHA